MEKPKKERTEAQKNATLRMLKAKREKKEQKPDSESESEKEVEIKEKKPRAKKEKVIEGKILEIDIPVTTAIPKIPEKPTYLTKEDFHAFRNDIMAAITPATSVVQEKKVIRKEKVRKETVYEDEEEEEPVRPKQRIQQPVERKSEQSKRQLTGYDLLDALLKR